MSNQGSDRLRDAMPETGAHAGRISHFGAFELHHRSGELFRHGYRIALQGQPARVLIALVESQGQTITRDTLQKTIWSDDTYVDFEASLNTAIKKIRLALGDSKEKPKFVQTIHGRGYRFIASVEIANPPEPEAVPVLESAGPSPPEAQPETSLRIRRAVLIAVGLAALFAAIAVFFYTRPAGRSGIDSIAVLPFINSDAAAEFAGDGISEEIID